MSRAFVIAAVAALLSVTISMQVAEGSTTYLVAAEVVNQGSSDGFDLQSQNDGSGNVKTEGSTTIALALGMANGDISLDWDAAVGACLGTHTGCLTPPPQEPDGDTSYVQTWVAITDPIDTDRYDVSEITFPVGVTIVGIDAFAWATWSAGPLIGEIYMNLYDGTLCTQQNLGVPIIAYTNMSTMISWAVSCDGDAWRVGDLANLRFDLTASSGTTGGTMKVSYAGILISYYTDYYTSVTSQFNGVTGISPSLLYECTTTDESQLLTVTYLAADLGTITCDGVEKEFALPLDIGTIQVTIYSAMTGDVTGSTFTFDVLLLQTKQQGDDTNGGGHGFDLVKVTCTPSLTEIHCLAGLIAMIPGIEINRSEWFIGSAFSGVGHSIGENKQQHFLDLQHFALLENLTVTVQLYLNNGQVLQGRDWVEINNSWIVLVVLSVILLLVILLIVHLVRKRSRREARQERKAKVRNDRRTLKVDNWRWQLWKE